MPGPRQSAAKVVLLLAASGVGLLLLLVLAVTFLGTDSTSTATSHDGSGLSGFSATTLPTIDHSGPGGLPAGLAAKPGDPRRSVDQATAGAVVRAAWSLRLVALDRHDDAELAKFETGTALYVDQHTCGCDPPPGTEISTWSASAPGDTGYPAMFVADVRWSDGGDPGQSLITFTRSSPDDVWRVALVAASGRHAVDPVRPVLSPDRVLVPASVPASPPGQDDTTISTDLAAWFQSWADTAGAPAGSRFPDTGGLRSRGQTIAETIRAGDSGGIHISARYRSDPTDLPVAVAAAVPSGSRLVCGTTRYTITFEPGSSGADLDHTGNADDPLPWQLEPGRYRRVVLDGRRAWCVQLLPDGTRRVFTGFNGEEITEATKGA